MLWHYRIKQKNGRGGDSAIALGEESGALDSLFIEVADFYDQEVEFDLKRMADAIEPLLICVMGLMVMVVALGVFLPMWDLATVARGGR